jgi:NADPH:quinone reductase-like Zn-dependent oxidoreductase
MEPNKMKAVVCTKYGGPEVLQLRKVEKPVPKENEMLVEIMATAVTRSDLFIRGTKMPLYFTIMIRLFLGILKPRRPIIGLVFAGIVRSVGSQITRFSPGDEVYGMTGFKLGAYAQFVCVKETDSTTGCVSLKPKNITFEESTYAVYGGSLAHQFMEAGNIKKDQNILIYGASGTTGTFAVQYGRYLGARVTGVCSTRHAEFVKTLGADHVLDYTTTETLDERVHFDFMLDAVGKAKNSKLKVACKKALTKEGIYATIDDKALELSAKRLDLITKLVEEGHIKPILDKIFPLEEIVEATKYVEEGHKRGGVAITVSHEE